MVPVLACSECGEALRPEEVKPKIGVALQDLAAQMENEGEPNPEIQELLARSLTK
jgi:hypothetical protein